MTIIIYEVPATITCVSVVLRKTVRIALMIATNNDLKVMLADILTAYIQILVIENVWATLHPDFRKDASKTAVIVRAFYSLLCELFC